MNKLTSILLIFFCSFLPTFLPAQDRESTDVERSGGIFPTESQADETYGPEITRPDAGNYQDIPSPGFTEQLHISSQTQNEIRPNYFVLEGYVDISHKGMRLQADRAEYDAENNKLYASGNVVLDQNEQRITGDRLALDLETQTGSMWNVFGYFPPQIFFWGTRLDKLGKDEYRLYDGVFTECSQIIPHWQLKSSSARMTVNEYIRFNNFTLKAKKIPFFYSPFMMWPIKRERSTGFLFPSFGPNNRKGFWVGGSFFWAMTRSMDSTYWLDHWSDRGWGGAVEYRYATGKESGGSAKYYYANDRLFGPQWSLNTEINQQLTEDMRIAAIADIFSDFDWIRDVENNLSRRGLRHQRAQGFFTKNWSYYNLNVLGDWTETEQENGNSHVRLFHSPEVEFRSRSQQLGSTPFFWSLISSFSQLGRQHLEENRKGEFTAEAQYQRYDIFPTISWPVTYLSWMTFTPTFAYRVTHYTQSLDPPQPNDILPRFLDQAVTRNYMDLTLDLRGPNFAKIFDTPTWSYSKKWKHAIEPQITYRYIQNIPERFSIIHFDSDVDSAQGIRVITYSITNLLYAKRPVKEEEEWESDQYQFYNPKPLEPPVETPWEFLSWRISQSYTFSSDSFRLIDGSRLRPLSPIQSELRINPTQKYGIDFRLDFDTYEKQITEIAITNNFRSSDAWYTNFNYLYRNPVIKTRRGGQHYLRSAAGVGLWKNRVVLSGQMDFDIENRRIDRNTLGILYNDDCFTVGVEWRHYDESNRFLGPGDENQFTFTISLPNIGNLVNFRNGAAPRKF